jgi:hypothetical protein
VFFLCVFAEGERERERERELRRDMEGRWEKVVKQEQETLLF